MTLANLTTSFAAITLATASLAAQAPQGLLFTTFDQERTACNKPSSLEQIEPQDVCGVRPGAPNGPCAAKFAPHDAWLTLMGDEDNDSRIFEATLGGKIDALLWRPNRANSSMRSLYISTAEDVGGCINTVGSPSALLDGDIARVQRDGQFAFFLREEQIKRAFRIPASVDIDVDAVTADCSRNIVYLSFENGVQIETTNAGPLAVRDGAIVAIQVTACGEPCTVSPGSGLLVATEADVDSLVNNSEVRGRGGVRPNAIGDLDGLHVDQGSYTNQWGTWNNLYFSGEALTGGAVCSTRPYSGADGNIGRMNGAALADRNTATTGDRVGLRTHAHGPKSLNGLEAGDASSICNFVMETAAPRIGAGGTFEFDIGGADPGVAVVIANVEFDRPCDVHRVAGPFPNSCFSQLIMSNLTLAAVNINPNGFGHLDFTVGGAGPGFDVVLQTITFGPGGFKLSTPMTIEVD